MLGFGLSLREFKGGFFDRAKVANKLALAERRNLSRAGAYVRQRARSSIRRRKRTAEPGQPPSSHEGSLRLILFAYQDQSHSVIVGPVRLHGSREGATVPALLERGGTVRRVDRTGKLRTLRYRAFPFMGPALAAERAKLAKLWENAVR